MRILLAGVRGSVRRPLVARLLDAGHQVSLLVRDHRGLYGLPCSVTLIEDGPGLLARLTGSGRRFDGVCLASGGVRVETAAMLCEVAPSRIVLVTSPMETEEDPHGVLRRPYEEMVRNSGAAWTFVAPGSYCTDARDWWSRSIRLRGEVRWVHPGARLTPVHEEDAAEVFTALLLEDRHADREYTLGGPETLTQEEQVRVIGETIGRTVPFRVIRPQEAVEALAAAGLAGERAYWVVETLADRVGADAPEGASGERITGRPPRTFRQWTREHIELFLPIGRGG